MSTKELLDALKEVRAVAMRHRNGKATDEDGWFSSVHGICRNAEECMRSVLDDDALKPVFATWPHFSGYHTYPVPSLRDDLYPSRMYQFTDDVWIGDYGDLRMDLLDHCIKTLEKDCEQIPTR